VRGSKLRSHLQPEIGCNTEGEVSGFSGASSGDWLRLDDEAVRVAVGARLRLGVLYKCSCGAEVDAEARHAMVVKRPQAEWPEIML